MRVKSADTMSVLTPTDVAVRITAITVMQGRCYHSGDYGIRCLPVWRTWKRYAVS